MRAAMVALTTIGLSLSAMSVPSVHAGDQPAPPTSVEEQLSELPIDALPPLCFVRDVDDEPLPSLSPTPSPTPSMSASPSVSPTELPSVSPTSSPSDSVEPSASPSPAESESLTPRSSEAIDSDSQVSDSQEIRPSEEIIEQVPDANIASEAPDEQGNESEDVAEDVAEEVQEELVELDSAASSTLGACPVAPTELSAEAANNGVRLTWSPGVVPSDHDRYSEPIAYYVSVTGAETRILRTTDTTFAVVGLRNGVEYSFEVFAATSAGRSAPVGPVTAIPTTGMEGVVAGLIVEFAEGVNTQAGSSDVPGQDRVGEVDLSIAQRVSENSVLVELSEPVDMGTAEKIAADLTADAQVEWAEPDQFFFTSSSDFAQTVTVPTDSEYVSSQWNLWDTYGVSVGDGTDSMTDAWAGSRGEGVTVAVIDTGITAHPDLDAQLVAGYDFVSNPEQLASSRQPNAPPVAFDGDYIDQAIYGALGRDANPSDPGDWREVTPVRNSSWHGTKIAGLIAAASNTDGITGISPNAKIQPIRALSWRGGLLSDVAASITWASGGTIDGVPVNANPSKVINMSFAVETICPTALQDAINGAIERGSILIAAAGNANNDAAKFAPGNCNGVITVAATNRDGNRADYTNYGDTIDISAPGGDANNSITTTANTGTQTPDQPNTSTDYGTSIAAAHVSAAAAILTSRNASITPSDAYTQLTGREYSKAFNNQTCDDANPDYTCGSGILSLAQVATGTCTQTERVVGGFVFVAFTAPGGVTCTYEWTPPSASVRVDYLVVGGGGGGGAGRGGGGGAGGFIGSTTPIDIAGPTTVQVGGGGVGGSNTPNNGTSGAESKLGTYAGAVAKGGGYGAGWNSGGGGVGGNGGSGGGASGSGDASVAAVSSNGGSGESGQGTSGGSNAPQSPCPGWADTGNYYCTGGGGGGAASAGTSGSTYTVESVEYQKAGNGGAGNPAPTWLTASARTALGISSFYAGGGGGAGQFASRTPGGDGGTGGGGDGCGGGVCNGDPGTANTGGGGGGSEGGGSQAGNGGSGIVVIRYASSCSSSSAPNGDYTVVTFNTAGYCTWTAPSQVRSIDVLAVGGGGGGGAWVGAGGGGGEVTDSVGLGVTPGNSYTVRVGAGGRGAEMRPGFSADGDAFVSGGNGTSSSFGSSVTALGGGVGGSASLQAPGGDVELVATGGGAPYANVNPGVGKVSSGGVAGTSSQPHPTGGGGGAQSGGGGGQGVSPFKSGAGGAGKASTITGVTYGGGGGGSAHGTWPTGTTLTTPTNEPGAGGDGGGGAGGQVTTAALSTVVQGVAGTDGLGGGGGGGANMWVADTTYGSIGGDGGDGTVIIRYLSESLSVTLGGGSQPGNYTYDDGWVTAPKVQLVDAAGSALTTPGVNVTAAFTKTSGDGSVSLVGETVPTNSSGVADFSGMTVRGAAGIEGTLTFTASGYGSVTSTSFSIIKANQAALSIDPPYILEYGATLNLATTGGSGTGAVSFSRTGTTGTARCLVVSAVASSRITGTNAGGTCTVLAVKAGDANYNQVLVEQAYTVVQATQATLSMSSPSTAIYGQTISLAAIGGSGTGALSFAVTSPTGSGLCSISGTTLTLGDAGSLCKVQATKAASTNYLVATSAEQTITITQAGQTVAFTSEVPETPERFDTYTPTAAAISTVTGSSSGVTPSFSASGNCTIAGGVVTFGLPGTCTVTASAASSLPNYSAAANVTQTIVIGSTNQTIDFTQPSNVAFGSASVAMSASTSSGGDVTFSLGAGTTNSACTVSSLGVVTILAVGVCEVVASAGAFDQYAAASDVTRAFQVLAALPTAPSLTSASASSEAITVAFTAPGFTGGASISGYQIVATPPSPGVAITTTACSSSPCTITGLTNGTAYTVTVAAINSVGTGPASAASTSLTPATAAFAVGSLSATPGDSTVTVSWTQPANLGGGTFTRYDLYSRPVSGTYGSATTIGSIGTTSYTVTGLNNGTSYEFKVVTITTTNGTEIPGNTAEVVQYPSTVPTAPQEPVVLAATTTDVQFSWAAPLSDGGAALSASPYTVTVTGSAGAATVNCTPSGTNTYCTANGLTNSASYEFSVVANNRMGSSPIASVTYNVPSNVDTLSALMLAGSAGTIAISPTFASGTVSYSASVDNAVSSVTVTPTTTSITATVMVNGVSVTSGTASSPIDLTIGVNSIRVLVTASDTRFTRVYTVAVTRAPAQGNNNWKPFPSMPTTPPVSVADGTAIGGVLLDGQVETDVLFTQSSGNSGWMTQGPGFKLLVDTYSPEMNPEQLSPTGVMQVPQGGFISVSATGYAPESTLAVFAIPRQNISAQTAVRSTSNAIWLGSAIVFADGTVSTQLSVPLSMNIGQYVLQVNGMSDTNQMRSVNLQLLVVPGLTMKASSASGAAFFEGKSNKLSKAGKQRVRALVTSIPSDAVDIQVSVIGVSVSLETSRANLRLARERAQELSDYLIAQGVAGNYRVSVFTEFTVKPAARSALDEISKSQMSSPMMSSSGKPLTTANITFEAPSRT